MPGRKKQEKNKSKDAGKKEKSINHKLRLLALFLAVILFLAVASEIVYLLYKIRYVKVLTAKLEVAGNVGFALGEEKLDIINFGTILPGGGGRRFITAENREKFDMLANIRVIGDIKEFLVYENNFIVKPNETKQINFEVFAPLNTAKGRYAGKIFLIFKRA